jgi:hypothetical protein
LSTKKCCHCEKYFGFAWINRKKAGLKRIRIAKKIHSSSLIDKTVSYWVESSKYDLRVAEAMFRAKKYPYALFMGHLALEKLLKGLVVKRTKAHAPFSHSLPYLAKKFRDYNS